MCFLYLLLSSGSLLAEDKAKEAEKHAIAGLQAFQAGIFEDAEKELSLAVKLDPKKVDYRRVLGTIYVRLSKYDKAIEQYVSALKLKPDDVELNYNLGYIYDFHKSDPAKAKNYYSKCLKLDPKGQFAENTYLYLGKIYFTEKNYDKAIAQYKGAAALKDSNAGVALYNLGLCYIKTDKLDIAEKELLESAKLMPTQALIYAALGELYMKKKDYSKVIENYQKAILYDSSNISYHIELAQAYESKGDLDSALSEYNTAISQNSKDAKLHYLAGSIYNKKGDFLKASEELTLAVELEINNKLYKETLAKVQSKIPVATPTPVQLDPPVTPVEGSSVSLSIKILEPPGFSQGSYQCNASKVRIVGIATAPSGSGIVEVLIDNVPARLSRVQENYSSEIPREGSSLQFEGEALLTLGDNHVKISAMDKTRTRIETIFIIKRLE